MHRLSISLSLWLLNLVWERWLAWVCGPLRHTGWESNKCLAGWLVACLLQAPSLWRAFSSKYGMAVGGVVCLSTLLTVSPYTPNSANSLRCTLTYLQPWEMPKSPACLSNPSGVSAQGSPSPAPPRISKRPRGGGEWPAADQPGKGSFPFPWIGSVSSRPAGSTALQSLKAGRSATHAFPEWSDRMSGLSQPTTSYLEV